MVRIITSERQPTRVLLADDNLPVRQGLKRLINEEPDMDVVAETGDGEEALRLAQRLLPDVALVDVSMPGWDGVRLAREMGAACPSLKVIAVTRHNDGGFVQRMMDAGACGYVLKQSATSTLIAAVRVCVAGTAYIDPGVRSSARPAERAVTSMPAVPTPSEPLTNVEEEVLRLFASAFSIQDIVKQLGIDREEVLRAKAAAMRKLGLTTRLQAMTYVRFRIPPSVD